MSDYYTQTSFQIEARPGCNLQDIHASSAPLKNEPIVDRGKLFEAAAFALVVLGVWLIAEVNVYGQYCMLAAQVLWLGIGLQRSMWALVAQSLVLFVLTARAICLWHLV